jgi:hypothetical protein
VMAKAFRVGIQRYAFRKRTGLRTPAAADRVGSSEVVASSLGA